MLWDQHRERYTVETPTAVYTARRITYWKFRELTASVSPDDLARIGRLNAKRESGDPLTPEEQNDLVELASRWPVGALRGACLIPPVDAEQCARILEMLPRKESEDLERILDMCITPEIPEADIADPLALALVASGGLGIDTADMTVGQGLAIATMLNRRE